MVFLRINLPNFVQFKQYYGKSGLSFLLFKAKFFTWVWRGGVSPPSSPGNYAYDVVVEGARQRGSSRLHRAERGDRYDVRRALRGRTRTDDVTDGCDDVIAGCVEERGLGHGQQCVVAAVESSAQRAPAAIGRDHGLMKREVQLLQTDPRDALLSQGFYKVGDRKWKF